MNDSVYAPDEQEDHQRRRLCSDYEAEIARRPRQVEYRPRERERWPPHRQAAKRFVRCRAVGTRALGAGLAESAAPRRPLRTTADAAQIVLSHPTLAAAPGRDDPASRRAAICGLGVDNCFPHPCPSLDEIHADDGNPEVAQAVEESIQLGLVREAAGQ